MLNNTGIKGPYTYDKPVQILENVEFQLSVGCIVPQALGTTVTSNGRTFKIAKAGTPININFADLNSIATVPGADIEESATAGIGSSTGITAATVTAATFGKKVSATGKYTFTYDLSGTKWKLGDTDVADITTYGIAVTGTPADGDTVIVDYVKAEEGVDANAVLLHNVDVTNGNNNGTALIWGFVNINRLEADVQELVTAGNNTVGQVTFLNA